MLYKNQTTTVASCSSFVAICVCGTIFYAWHCKWRKKKRNYTTTTEEEDSQTYSLLCDAEKSFRTSLLLVQQAKTHIQQHYFRKRQISSKQSHKNVNEDGVHDPREATNRRVTEEPRSSPNNMGKKRLIKQMAEKALLGIKTENLKTNNLNWSKKHLQLLLNCSSSALAEFTPRKKFKRLVGKFRMRIMVIESLLQESEQKTHSNISACHSSTLNTGSPISGHDAKFASDLDQHSTWFLALTFAGFEHVCVSEIHQTLSVPMKNIFIAKDGCELLPAETAQVRLHACLKLCV